MRFRKCVQKPAGDSDQQAKNKALAKKLKNARIAIVSFGT